MNDTLYKLFISISKVALFSIFIFIQSYMKLIGVYMKNDKPWANRSFVGNKLEAPTPISSDLLLQFPDAVSQNFHA